MTDFNFLGSYITEEGSSKKEIDRRIAMAKSATISLTQIWKDRSITKTTKIRLMHTLVFPIFLYGAETWTIKNREKKRISAFEMWA